MNKCILPASVAAIALLGAAAPSKAATVTTTTVVQSAPTPDREKINIMAFDTNHDGILSMREVGDKLFEIFDQDHNGSIDNIEFNKKVFMTLIPMEKDTYKFIDYNDDGQPDAISHTTESFMADSHLKRFDKDGNGLSPAEFIQTGYEKLDIDNDKLISLHEWQKAYMASVMPAVDEPGLYNK